MLHQNRLIRRVISIWGLAGAAIVLIKAALDLHGIPAGDLGVIMLINELFLGSWLIVKGC